MAYSQAGSGPAKLSSYAKIAAMPAPTVNHTHNIARNDSKIPASSTSPPPPPPPPPPLQEAPKRSLAAENAGLLQDKAVQASIEAMPAAIHKLDLDGLPTDHTNSEPNADSADSYEEDQSQISSSSLNKPQSFDTKSLASVTTFAMDDKESIRPDDSASVRAADDEHPPPTLSRHSSFQHDNEPPSHRPSRVFPSNVTLPGRRFPTLANLPRFGNLPISPVLESQDVQMPQPPTQIMSPDDPREPNTVVGASPDEKLIDALASAKDRLPLLQLEEKVLSFLANSSHSVLELPPQNSFTRLLTHKLADYYSLPHAVNEDNTSVRIFRNGSRAAPVPLAQLAKAVPLGSTTGPSTAAVKIMRRERLGSRQLSAGNSTAPSSSVPSKTTSENGAEGPSDDGLASPAESTPNRDKSRLTREEREAQYKAARDRIFADFQESVTSDTGSTGDQSASMSRSSSSSGKKKNRRNKPRDDSFEARSAFALTYAPVQSQYQNMYMDPSMMGAYPMSPTYDQPMYGATPTQTYHGFDGNMPYPQMQGFNPAMMPQMSPNDWQAMQNMQMQEAYMMYQQTMQYQQPPNMSMAGTQAMQSHGTEWYGSQNQGFMGQMYSGSTSPFQQQLPDQRYQMQPDGFGQQFHRASTAQGPVSGPYAQQGAAKSLFNPQTRSFVPNNGQGRPGGRATRQKNASRRSPNAGANNHTATASAAHPSKEDSLKLKYGTPASLPKKPPPPSDGKHPSDAVDTSSVPQQESLAVS